MTHRPATPRLAALIAVGIGNTTTHLAVYDNVARDGWPEPAQTAALRTPELVAEPRSDGLLEQVALLMRKSGDFRHEGPGSGEPGYGALRWCVSSVQRAAEPTNKPLAPTTESPAADTLQRAEAPVPPSASTAPDAQRITESASQPPAPIPDASVTETLRRAEAPSRLRV